jgi:folate-binding protein YgfZ
MSEVFAPARDTFDADFDRLRDDCGLVELPHLRFIELKGEDRKGWLQGQATNDLRQLDNGANYSFCLCDLTGHLLSVCEIWGLKDRFIFSAPVQTEAAVLRRIESMVVLEDVSARPLADEVTVVSIQGPRATRSLGELMALPLLDAGEVEFEGAILTVLRSNRTGLGGWDVLAPVGAKKALTALRKRFSAVGFEAFDAARLEAGRPFFGRDCDEKTMPPEMGLEFENRHVSYQKGCYVGQEVLMRIHSRGHVNRRWVGLVADDPLEAGAVVSHRLRPEAGLVTSAAFSPDQGYIAGAMVRHEVAEEGELVSVATSHGVVSAEVRRMPLLRLD